MKVKRLIPFLALMLCFSTFGGCTQSDQKIVFGNYWNENAVDAYESVHQTFVYSVTFEKSSGMDSVDYDLSYTDGTYTTVLESTKDEQGVASPTRNSDTGSTRLIRKETGRRTRKAPMIPCTMTKVVLPQPLKL